MSVKTKILISMCFISFLILAELIVLFYGSLIKIQEKNEIEMIKQIEEVENEEQTNNNESNV